MIDRLSLENYSHSWHAAQELFEHELWPKGLCFSAQYLIENGNVSEWPAALGDRTFVISGYMPGIPGYHQAFFYEKTLPLAITRAFVMAHHLKPQENPDAA